MFRFTIREMFLVVVIVALGVGWWVDHRNMAGQLAGANRWRHAAGAAEVVLKNLGWKTKWKLNEDRLEVFDGPSSWQIPKMSDFEPSEPFPE